MIAESNVLNVGKISCPHYHMVPKDKKAHLAYRKKMLRLAGDDALAQSQLRTMCNEDILFYVNTFCWTYDSKNHPDQPVLPFNTFEFQDEAIMNIADCIAVGEDYVVPKSRQMGASWMGITTFEWYWHFKAHLTLLFISRNEDYVDKKGDSKALFWKIDFLHQYQPNWLLPSGRWLGWKDPGRKALQIVNADNESILIGESTTGDAGRGANLAAMFIDEHAAFELNDGFNVLSATRDATNCRGFNSTPKGANNGFYNACHELTARQIRLHWTLHPDKNKGMYSVKDGKVELLDKFRGMVKYQKKGDRAAKKVMFPDDYPFSTSARFPIRSPWFDLQCGRCASDSEIAQELEIDFLGSDYQFFDAEFIEIYRKRYCRPHTSLGTLEFDNENCTPNRFVENRQSGKLYLWLVLAGDGTVAKDRKFVIGSDVSAGTGASNSVSCVVDRATGEKVAVFRTPHLRPTEFASATIALARFFNNAYLIWDAGGPTGKTFTQQVIRKAYGNIYYRRNEKKIGQDITDEPGYFLTPKARENLLEDYRAALSDHKYINRSERGIKECLQFIRKPDGTIEHSAAAHSQDPSGAKTAHGDEVVGDALANKGLEERQTRPEPSEPDVPEGCLAWRRKLKAEEEAKENEDRLDDGW
jgi:hypothetical protein